MRLAACRRVSAAARVERVTQAVTEEVERQNGDEDREAGDDHEQRVDLVVVDGRG